MVFVKFKVKSNLTSGMKIKSKFILGPELTGELAVYSSSFDFALEDRMPSGQSSRSWNFQKKHRVSTASVLV